MARVCSLVTRTQFLSSYIRETEKKFLLSMPTATELRTAAIAPGRTIKRVNALTAILYGAVPAVLLDFLFRASLRRWLVGFAAGLLWANFFEYAYHRFLLHLAGTFLAEELHWRIHLGGWLPPGFHAARGHHLAHHARPNARFNIFLPLWDRMLGTSGG